MIQEDRIEGRVEDAPEALELPQVESATKVACALKGIEVCEPASASSSRCRSVALHSCTAWLGSTSRPACIPVQNLNAVIGMGLVILLYCLRGGRGKPSISNAEGFGQAIAGL